jgi:uncharacterized protein YggE
MAIGRSFGTLPAIALCLAVVSARPPLAAAGDEAKTRSITVIGIGRERGTPDTARLQFAVEHTAPSAQAASQAAAKTATQVMEALRKEVGSGGRVDTAGFNLNPVYRTDDRPPARERKPEIVGYTAVNQIAVQTRRVENAGTLIDTAIAAGAARIGGLSFSIEDSAPLQARALKAAGADATAQVAAIAEALHVRVKDVLEASTEWTARPIPQQRWAGAAMAAEAMTAATPIEPGEVTTEARLRVTYGVE